MNVEPLRAPRRRIALAVALLAALLIGSQPLRGLDLVTYDLVSRASAATPDAARGERLYAEHCVGCHKLRGHATGPREYPQLAGQQEQYLLEQLAQFVTLDRFAPQMHRVLDQSALADPQSLRDLSFFLAGQRHDPHGEHGDAHRIGRGRQFYADRCTECHGKLGEGRAMGPIPAIGGQNYTYLLTQLKGFASGHRARAERAVIDAVSRLSSNDMRAVADFISRLPESSDTRYGVVDGLDREPSSSIDR